jgi:oligo-1,6-glucosidase
MSEVMEGPGWWKSAVVYQIYPRSFQDSNGDGIGDLSGIMRRLDHLARLGIDVIWLSPIYRSPQADNGYDISDYQDIDPVFGTLDDFDRLLSAVHQRGMKLVMDLVVNHTSDEHPWFIESRSSRSNVKRDWYLWRGPREGYPPGQPGSEPNNWESFFSGSVWTWDEASAEYYLHLFDRKQPDLNWENPEVRRAVYEMMRWWLDRGVDGFRMDVINFISKDPALPDAEPIAGRQYADGLRHYAAGPRLHEYLQEMRLEVFNDHPGIITVGETPGTNTGDALLLTDPARGELDMVFQFEHVELDRGVQNKFDRRPLPAGELADSLSRWQEALSEIGWNSLYLGNHDQPRCVSRFGDDGEHWRASATALATMLHLQRGTPYVYQGDELGMTNSAFETIEDYRDIESLNYYADAVTAGAAPEEVLASLQLAGRDNARTPMQWDDSPCAGFTNEQPWIAVNSNLSDITAAKQYEDQHSIFNHYRALIALRHSLPVISHGSFTRIETSDPSVFAFERRLGSDRLLVIANLSSATAPPAISTGSGTDWRSTDLLITNDSRISTPFDNLNPWASAAWLVREAPKGPRAGRVPQ